MDAPSKVDTTETATPFHLSGSNESFTNRSNDVFASLGHLEAKHSAVVTARSRSVSSEDESLIKMDPEVDEDEEEGSHKEQNLSQRDTHHSHRHRSSSSRRHDGHPRERNDARSRSLERDRYPDQGDGRRRREDFARPNHRPTRGRKRCVPDFKLHPERWIQDSLRTVSETDMSDRSNTRAALSFLDERRKDRERQERIAAGLPAEETKFDVSDGACSQGKISFSKPSRSQNKDISEGAKESKEKDSKQPNKKKDVDLSGLCDSNNDSVDDVHDNVDHSVKNSVSVSQDTFKGKKKAIRRNIRTKNFKEEGEDSD